MGIRDTSYYGWRNVDEYQPTVSGSAEANYTSVATDSSGTLYACGTQRDAIGSHRVMVRKSIDRGSTWDNVLVTSSFSVGNSEKIRVDSFDRIYVVGYEKPRTISRSFIFRSSDRGETWSNLYNFSPAPGWAVGDKTSDVVADSDGKLYCIVNPVSNGSSSKFYSSDDDGLTWTGEAALPSSYQGFSLVVDSSDNIWTSANHYIYNATHGDVCKVFRFDGSSWNEEDSYSAPDVEAIYVGDIFFPTDKSDYILTSYSSTNVGYPCVRRLSSASWSTDCTGSFSGGVFASDSKDDVFVFSKEAVPKKRIGAEIWESIDWQSGSVDPGDGLGRGIVVYDDDIFLAGQANGNKATIRKGRLTANSCSLGPSMLSPSFGYVLSEFSGSTNEGFKLNNISEFPHSSGLFQMKNMVLGTQDVGTVGNTEDNIIQINHFGSIVKIMWPKQADQIVQVGGFGDSSAGQRSGKLSDSFVFGDFVDVTEHDHLSLYCYLRKQVSGSLDSVEITVERRPLKSVGFTTEQTIEYEVTGSVTYANLTDLRYKKEIDYADLDIKEIGYPIDIPLINVRELRIAAKHTTGQTEELNKNFIVWGRLIKSEEET